MWLERPGYVESAWRYFESGTMSIEILKDDLLQKAYFNVRDKVGIKELCAVKLRMSLTNYSATSASDMCHNVMKLQPCICIRIWWYTVMDHYWQTLSNPVTREENYQDFSP